MSDEVRNPDCCFTHVKAKIYNILPCWLVGFAVFWFTDRMPLTVSVLVKPSLYREV